MAQSTKSPSSNKKTPAKSDSGAKKTPARGKKPAAAAASRQAAEQLRQEQPFDVIFMDPPYLKGLEKEILEVLQDAECITDETLFVVEASLQTDFSWLSQSGYEIIKEKKYKTNEHMFLRHVRGEKK